MKNSLRTLPRFYFLPVEQILIRVVELVVETAGKVDPLAVEAIGEVAECGSGQGGFYSGRGGGGRQR